MTTLQDWLVPKSKLFRIVGADFF